MMKRGQDKKAHQPGALAPCRPSADGYDIAAWILTGAALLLAFPLHLFSALMAGLLVHELVHVTAPLFTRKSSKRAKLVVITILAVIIAGGLTIISWKAAVYMRGESGNVQMLLTKMAEILEDMRSKLPGWAVAWLPENVEEVNRRAAQMLRDHMSIMQQAGKGVGLTAAHVLIGLVLGAIVSLAAETNPEDRRPFARALTERVARISRAFRAVVFAQVRISLLNTTLTFLYLIILLPAMGIHLPLAKTMVAITFLVGLLPVVGNLVSNTIIVVVSLSVSFWVAVWSLCFLIVIHKLEYFLNARIVGGHIHAKTWELLIAMLVMEAAFGLPGLVAAPVYYAYVKQELVDRGVV